MSRILSSVLCLALLMGSALGDDLKNGPAEPELGSPYGTLIEIEGRIVTDQDTGRRAHLGKKLIEITRVGAKEMPTPIIMELAVFAFTDLKIPARGEPARFRGYESGSFTGIPQEAFKDIPRVATTEFHFKSYFQITKKLKPSPVVNP